MLPRVQITSMPHKAVVGYHWEAAWVDLDLMIVSWVKDHDGRFFKSTAKVSLDAIFAKCKVQPEGCRRFIGESFDKGFLNSKLGLNASIN